jgi:hypothetical protein
MCLCVFAIALMRELSALRCSAVAVTCTPQQQQQQQQRQQQQRQQAPLWACHRRRTRLLRSPAAAALHRALHSRLRHSAVKDRQAAIA